MQRKGLDRVPVSVLNAVVRAGQRWQGSSAAGCMCSSWTLSAGAEMPCEPRISWAC